MMEKKPYARIDFKNLDLDYDYTICELQQISDYTGLFKHDVEDLDESGYETWKKDDYLPEVTITVVMMTPDEYSKWFEKNIESGA